MNGELIVTREIDGHLIGQRRADGYFDATAMCKAADKRWNDYWRLDGTTSFLSELEAVAGIPATALVQVRQGGTPGEQGTWVHPDVAIHLAQWCSARFAVQVSRWVRALLTEGYVELAPEPTGDRIIDGLLVSRRCVDALIETRRVQIEMGARLEETWDRVGVLDAQIAVVDAKADAAGAQAEAAMRRAEGNHGYFSVLGYYKRNSREVSAPEASTHGKRLTRICGTRGLHVQQISDGRHGYVNTYPESVLCEYFERVWATEGN